MVRAKNPGDKWKLYKLGDVEAFWPIVQYWTDRERVESGFRFLYKNVVELHRYTRLDENATEEWAEELARHLRMWVDKQKQVQGSNLLLPIELEKEDVAEIPVQSALLDSRRK